MFGSHFMPIVQIKKITFSVCVFCVFGFSQNDTIVVQRIWNNVSTHTHIHTVFGCVRADVEVIQIHAQILTYGCMYV